MRNWAGNHVYRMGSLHEPRSLDELQETVRAARSLRVIGTGHTFNDLADSRGDAISLRRMPSSIDVDPHTRTVGVGGPTTYAELSPVLHDAGWALSTLASLTQVSIAGSCATASHGSGNRLGCLSAAVRSARIVRADGELETIEVGPPALKPGGDPPLNGAAASLGALGVVVHQTLAIEPSYFVCQDVHEHIPFAIARDRFEDLMSAADAVSLFTDWSAPVFHQVWLKRRVGPDNDAQAPELLFGARAATWDVHPIPGFDAAACTTQRGVPGPWHERLPHFRPDRVPSAGAELQSEYLIDRSYGPGALDAIAGLAGALAPLVLVSEVRTVAADDLWLGPASGRASAAFHFTWRPDPIGVAEVLPLVEKALAPFEPRPHWGKLFAMPPEVVRDAYPRRPLFVELARRMDPEGVFRNDLLDRYVFGPD